MGVQAVPGQAGRRLRHYVIDVCGKTGAGGGEDSSSIEIEERRPGQGKVRSRSHMYYLQSKNGW